MTLKGYPTWIEEESARMAQRQAMPGRRKARLSAGGRNILRMLGPYPWEPNHADLTINGQNVSWSAAYDQQILGQSSAPGFPRSDRKAILAAYGEHRTRPANRNRRNRHRLGPQVHI